MAAKHYNKDGSLYKGKVHRMPNGQIHTGSSHTARSRRVYHFKDLSAAVKKKIKAKG